MIQNRQENLKRGKKLRRNLSLLSVSVSPSLSSPSPFLVSLSSPGSPQTPCHYAFLFLSLSLSFHFAFSKNQAATWLVVIWKVTRKRNNQDQEMHLSPCCTQQGFVLAQCVLPLPLLCRAPVPWSPTHNHIMILPLQRAPFTLTRHLQLKSSQAKDTNALFRYTTGNHIEGSGDTLRSFFFSCCFVERKKYKWQQQRPFISATNTHFWRNPSVRDRSVLSFPGYRESRL